MARGRSEDRGSARGGEPDRQTQGSEPEQMARAAVRWTQLLRLGLFLALGGSPGRFK